MNDDIPEQTGFLYFLAITFAVSVSGALSIFAFSEMFCGTWTPVRAPHLPVILCFATGFISGLIPVKKWWLIPLAASVLPLNMIWLMYSGGMEKGMGPENIQVIHYFSTILGACLIGWAVSITGRTVFSWLVNKNSDERTK